MKKVNRSNFGVTLLEVMLVLVIISVIVVASVRYYKNASDNSNTNSALSALQSIALSADNYATTSTSTNPGYAGFTSDSIFQTAMPATVKNTPWGGVLALTTPAATVRTFNISYSLISSTLCSNLTSAISNTKWSVGTCPSAGNTGSVTFTYTN